MFRRSLYALLTLCFLHWSFCNEDKNIGHSLDYLGFHIFSQPSKETGRRLKEWNDSWEANPEELGDYIEGDILFPIEMAKNGLILETARWPNGTIPYEITGSFTARERQILLDVMRMYREKTCIKFRPRRPSDDDWINIMNDEEGCWSSIGRRGGDQTVNLQTPYCLIRIGTVIHELLHAIGFLHEQCTWNRDLFITIKWENVIEGKEINFLKASRKWVTNFGIPYDYDSILHYSKYAFSKNNNPTIVTKIPGIVIGQRNDLSEKDLEKVRLMYNCPQKVQNTYDNVVPKANKAQRNMFKFTSTVLLVSMYFFISCKLRLI